MFKNSFLTSCAAVILMACGGNNSVNSASMDDAGVSADTTAQPVETDKPNSNYKPAFEGQTRVKGVTTKTPYEAKVLTSDLKKPWGIAILPDGRLLITEKEGTMRIATTDGQLSAPITGLPAVNAKGQGGLLGLTIDPQFSSNRMVYWVFSENRPGGTLTG
jgi:glucose/arabinose dehydrogenase